MTIPPPLSPSVPAAPGTRYPCPHYTQRSWLLCVLPQAQGRVEKRSVVPGGTDRYGHCRQVGQGSRREKAAPGLAGLQPALPATPGGCWGKSCHEASWAVGPGMGEEGGVLPGVTRGLSPHPCHLPTGANGSPAGSRLGPRSVPRWDSRHIRRFPSSPCQPATPQRSWWGQNRHWVTLAPARRVCDRWDTVQAGTGTKSRTPPRIITPLSWRLCQLGPRRRAEQGQAITVRIRRW